MKNNPWKSGKYYLALVVLVFTVLTLILSSCNYNQGSPIIVKKVESFSGKCIYTYEGYGDREWFEDDCSKYSIGDTLGK